MQRVSVLVWAGIIVLLTMQQAEARKKKPSVIVIRPSSPLASRLLAGFTANQYKEETLQTVTAPQTGEKVYRYRWRSRHPIRKVLVIPPHHIQLNGSERDYIIKRDFTIFCNRRFVSLESKHLGFYHMSVVTSQLAGRGKRAIEVSSNTILNAGMMETCGGMCSSSSCSSDCSNRTRVNFECPPYDDCSFISGDATLGLPETMNGTIVNSCNDFVTGVCNKYSNNGNQAVDILVQAHGANGIFCFGPPGGPTECVSKNSSCYNSICNSLRDKIGSLTIYSCSVAGGTQGGTFQQCLANCLNAEVKAYKKTLYLGSTGGASIMWSIVEGFQEPCVVTPTPSSSVTPTATSTTTSTSSTSTSTSTTSTSSTTTTTIPTPPPTVLDYEPV